MNSKIKRLLSLMLAFVMVFCMFPTNVFATGEETTNTEASTPAGNIQIGYITGNYSNNGISAITGEAVNVVATESFVVKMYHGETLVGTAALNDTNKLLLNGELQPAITWHASLTDDGDTWWNTNWVGGALKVDAIPDKVELWVDDVKVSDGDVVLNSADDADPVVAAVVDANGVIEKFINADGYVNNANYAQALQDAVTAAVAGDTIALLRDVEKLPVINKAITIDGLGHTVTASADEHQFGTIEGTVTLKNLVYANGTNAIRTDYASYDYSKMTLVVEGCTFNDVTEYAIMGGSTADPEKTLGGLTVSKCIFNAGAANGNYLVYAQSVNTLNITGCTFNGNDVTKGAIHTGDSQSHATVANISGNTIDGVARGVQVCNRVEGSAITVSGNTFTNVTDAADTKSGAVYIHSISVAATTDVTISANSFDNASTVLYNDQKSEAELKEMLAFAEDNTLNGAPITEVTTAGTEVEITVGTGSEVTYVAMIGEQGYETFAEALTAASAMTGDVTVEIYDKVTLNTSLSGSYDSIKFVGMDTDAEIYLDVQGFITAEGKKVAFKDLTLSKSEGGFITDAGFMNVAFGVYRVAEVTYTGCTFANGAYASSGKVTYTSCTFKKSHGEYGLWAYGDAEIVVDDCTFADDRGIKMYAEGAAKVTDLTVKNSNFSALTQKPAIVLTYGESVTLEGNTYSDTGVFELDLDGAPNGTPVTSDVVPTCKNDNGPCGVLVDGKIYTTVAQAAEVATSGSTVTLLHESTETVELAEGVILDRNGYTAAGVTVKQSFVAMIGETGYATLAEAVAAAQAGDTITLIADVTIASGETVELTGVNLIANEGVTLTNNGTVYVSGISDIAANVTGSGWVYMNGVTLDADTKLYGAKVGFLNGTNTIVGSVIDDGWFNVGIGMGTDATAAAEFAEANDITMGDVTVNVSGNAIIGAGGETYAGWVGSAYSADKTLHKYVLNIDKSAAAFGYLHVSLDGTVNVTGSVADEDKLYVASGYQTFYAGDLIVNGVMTLDDVDARVQYGKISVDNTTTTPGTLNIKNGAKVTFAAEGNANSALKWWNSGIVNIEGSTVTARTPSITETGALNITNATFTTNDTLTNNGTINVNAGETTLNIATLTGNTIDLNDGAIVKDSTVGGVVYVAGNVTFRGDNTFTMIKDYGNYYNADTPSMWTVEKGGSLTLTSTDRYGLGYGDNVTIYGELDNALTARENLTDADADVNMYGGLVGMTNSAAPNAQNKLTVEDAYVIFGVEGDKSFGNAVNYYGNYEFIFDNSVITANGFKFYEDLGSSVLSMTGSDLLVNGVFMTNDASSKFTFTDSVIVSNATSNGTDVKNQNAGELTLIRSSLTYNAPFTNVGTLTLGAGSSLAAPSITGEGTIVIDATGMTAGEVSTIDADASGFTGTIKVVNNDALEAQIVDSKIVLVEKAFVAQIGDTGYASLAEALTAAQAAGITDLEITIIGENTSDTEDTFDLAYGTAFASITIKQDNGGKAYYIDGIYTGDRTVSGGQFVLDGVNIISTGNIWFECDVVLKNNSVLTRPDDSKNFVYYGNLIIEPGSKFVSQIDDIMAGTMTVDGGKNDGTYSSEPDYKSIYVDVRAGQTLTLQNGAYALFNSSNEVGRLTLYGNAVVTASKLEVFNDIVMNSNSLLQVNANSQIIAQKITGAGTIVIDATGMTAGEVSTVDANASGFTGTIEVVNNDALKAQIDENGKIVLVEAYVAAVINSEGNVVAEYLTLAEALENAQSGNTVKLLDNTTESLVLVPAGVTLDLNGNVVEAGNVLSFGVVADTAATVGGIKISKDTTTAFTKLQPENGGYLPIYDTRDGMYKFFEYQLENVGAKADAAENAVKFGIRIKFTNANGYDVLANTAESNVKLSAKLAWTGSSSTIDIMFTFDPVYIAEYATAAASNPAEIKAAITLKLTGLDSLSAEDTISATPVISTIAEVTCENEAIVHAIS